AQQQKCYWWDVLYRHRLAEGDSEQQAHEEGLAMKSWRTDELEGDLIARYGSDDLKPRGDHDPPYTDDELAEFAKHPLVHLGNHTTDHAILTNYAPEQVREQVLGAQDVLREITGRAPTTIAYPNGDESDVVVDICRSAGLKLGFTIVPQKNLLPL